jgi:hypothetical protein
MEEALLFLASSWAALVSLMRLWRIWAYSFWELVNCCASSENKCTYGSILGSLSTAALECDPVALVLQTLRSNQTLDFGSLGVGLLAFTLGLNLTTDDELADLYHTVYQLNARPRLNPSQEGLAKKL